MRLVPSTEAVPSSLSRYLLPNKRHVISVREHPAVLVRPILLTLVGLAIAGWLSNSVANGNGTAILIIWVAWGLLLLWLVLKIANWSVHYFAVTSHRLMLARGLITRRVNMIPLPKITDIEFTQTSLGRLLGYGDFEVTAAGLPDMALRHIRFLPYPGQLYLEVCGLMFMGGKEPSGE